MTTVLYDFGPASPTNLDGLDTFRAVTERNIIRMDDIVTGEPVGLHDATATR
jgi:hypothetical protein